MAKVRNVEKRIYDIEGFEVTIQNGNGRALQDNNELPMYNPGSKMACNSWSVQEWKEKRFYTAYPGCKAKVLLENGKGARGNQHLSTIRDTYLAEDE
jgi:hypothetical protein